MKSARSILLDWEKKLLRRWEAQPIHKQRIIVVCAFICYIIITTIVVGYVWQEGKKRPININRHIENPLFKFRRLPELERLPVPSRHGEPQLKQ